MDQEGRLTGPEVAYIYPDCLTVLLGQFSDGQMVAGREHRLTGLQEDERGVRVPTFQRSDSPDHLHLHRRQIGRYDYICDGNTSRLSLLILPPVNIRSNRSGSVREAVCLSPAVQDRGRQ